MSNQLPWIAAMVAVVVVPFILAWLDSYRVDDSIPTPETCIYKNTGKNLWLCIDPEDNRKIGGGETKELAYEDMTRLWS